MKIKHFIITRFLNDDTMSLGRKVLNKEIIYSHLDRCKRYLYSSLIKQTCKNFEWIILIHPEVNQEYIKELYRWKDEKKIDIHIFAKNEYYEYLLSEWKNNDIIITSRMDDDDCMHRRLVEDIQKNSITDSHRIITPGSCMMYFDSSKTGVYWKRPCIEGGMSVMLTFVANTTSLKDPIDIYDLGNHNHVVVKMRELFGKSEEDFIVLDSDDKISYIPFLYVVHDDNDSILLNESIKEKRNNMKQKSKEIDISDYA